MPASSPALFSDFCPVLSELLVSRRATGRTGKEFNGLGALSSVNNLAVLRELCLKLKPQRTLEVGMCFGGSALVFTASHRDLKHSPRHQHVAIDPFQTSFWDDAGAVAVERAGLEGFLDLRRSFSSLELPQLLLRDAMFDLVYIDGSHLFEDVFVDFYYVARLLAPGGIVAFDDCSDPNVAKVLAFIRKNLGGAFQEFGLNLYRFDKGRSWRYRAATLLGKRQFCAFRRVGKADREWDAEYRRF
jgi:predicted O-methyltransferase YrrM